MRGIDDAVEQLERFYRTVTGAAVPSGPSPYAPIPPEKDAVRHVEEQLDRLVQLLAGSLPAIVQVPWIPRAAILEGEREVLVQLELPGVPRDSLAVSVVSNVLTVNGSRPGPLLGKDRPALRATEIPTGPFARSFPLPQGTSAADISAQLRDGMLELRIPRPAAQRPASAPSSANVVIR